MTLAGVYVHGQDKVGRDAGELCGIAPMNVTATDSIDEIVELGADVPPREGCRRDAGPGVLGRHRNGQRYVDETGAEVLVTKAGAGSLSVGTTALTLKEAKPLPASD